MENGTGGLCRTRKMEALARMTASLSHDLNNILGAIEGYATLLLNAMPKDDPSRPDIEEIHKAERRAADIIRKLMLFSRGGAGRRTEVDMRDILAGLAKKARAFLAPDIAVEISCQEGLAPAQADPALLEQALLNLVMNAGEAMPAGGLLRMSAADAPDGAGASCPRPAERPSGFLRVSISDNGCGMTPEIMDRLFEPFFTTKPKGKGTGMGLSVAYGIVNRHNGWTEVSSEPGKGSVFTVYLPKSAGVASGPDRK
ncbi:MAG TPA: ATP-binding protein [Elusimicrobiales bacterium]|nr:ATP-binding protein [Elusimicrobiales bacterium]